MREIRFRAWDKRFKWMNYGAGDLLLILDEKDYSEAMQFTGLKDRNGKEIYEGDICRNGEWEEDAGAYHYTNDVVRWDNNNACWLGWNYDENELSCEVIGNIYENPELLNKLSDKENG